LAQGKGAKRAVAGALLRAARAAGDGAPVYTLGGNIARIDESAAGGRLMRCIVIGAGIIGTTVALRLAQRGAAVTLLDQGLPGGGTTGTTFAWVNASAKEPRSYFDLNAAGMAAH